VRCPGQQLLPGSGRVRSGLCRSRGLRSGVRCSGDLLLDEQLLPDRQLGQTPQPVRRTEGWIVLEAQLLHLHVRSDVLCSQGLCSDLLRSHELLQQGLRPELRRSVRQEQLLHADRLLCGSVRNRSADLSVDDRLPCERSGESSP
jgi:hypothetical protein